MNQKTSTTENINYEKYEYVPLFGTHICTDRILTLDNPVLPGPESGVTHQMENTNKKIHVNKNDCK